MEALSEEKINAKLKEIGGWEYHENALHTSYEFGSFKDAFAMMTRISFEVERLNHHPDWTNIYNTLHISLYTHDADGVTEKDLELARVINDIIN